MGNSRMGGKGKSLERVVTDSCFFLCSAVKL